MASYQNIIRKIEGDRMKIYTITTERNTETCKELINWNKVSYCEIQMEEFALEFLKSCVEDYSNLKKFKEDLTDHAKDFDGCLHSALSDMELHYGIDADVCHSETEITDCRFKAYQIFNSIFDHDRKYITEHDIESGISQIIEDR